MQTFVRLAMLAVVSGFLAPAAHAATHMPIGFYDDASFRWSPDQAANLERASTAGASIIHTTASWTTIAPTRPANAANGSDPAYQLGDLDELVQNAGKYGLRVMINITGTPRWANGGKTPNHMPRRLSDLTTFARMLASRFDGRHGHGDVSLWSVWNEPNLQLFLTPQYSGNKIVSPAEYAKLYRAAYAGIKAGNRYADVAIGETSNLGRDHPTKVRGQGQSVAPGTFARLLARQKGLKFAAWATHPYPSALNAKPLARVRYPNVSLSQLPTFETNLRKLFHREVPIWVTEYGYETKPAEPHGVTYAQQASYLRQAIVFARKDPDVQMFTWFTFRDSPGNPWQSGIEQPSGALKHGFAVFASIARSTDGVTSSARPGGKPSLTVYVPRLSYDQPPGSLLQVSYTVEAPGSALRGGTTTAILSASESVTFRPSFTVRTGTTYTVTAIVTTPDGQKQTRRATIIGS